MALWEETHYISHPAKIESHRHCVNGYVMILVCHVNLQDHVVIWSCDFMGRSVTQGKSSFCHICGHKHCDSGDIMFLVCHMISQNHVIVWYFDFMGKRQSRYITILPSFVAIDIVVVEI